jgi:hypothetical protein
MPYSEYQRRLYMLYGYIDLIEFKDLIFTTSHPGASYLLRRCLNIW